MYTAKTLILCLARFPELGGGFSVRHLWVSVPIARCCALEDGPVVCADKS